MNNKLLFSCYFHWYRWSSYQSAKSKVKYICDSTHQKSISFYFIPAAGIGRWNWKSGGSRVISGSNLPLWRSNENLWNKLISSIYSIEKKYDRLNICAIRPKITEKSSIAKEQLDGILNQHLKVICKFHCRVFFWTNYILTAGLS